MSKERQMLQVQIFVARKVYNVILPFRMVFVGCIRTVVSKYILQINKMNWIEMIIKRMLPHIIEIYVIIIT